MTTELEFTELEDPFGYSSSFSLLPKTLARCSGSSNLDTAVNPFISLIAKGSPKIMQEVQIISNSVSDIDNLYKEDENTDVNYKNRGQERRAALGRKRPKFSMMLDVPSYSKPDLNIDNIEDPDEYFRAFEQMENAKKEIQKLRGGISMDVMQQDQATKARKRRPGLLGRRASYRHRISEDDAMAETFAKIQEKKGDAINCSSSLMNSELVDGMVSPTSNANSKLQEAELKDFVAEKEVNELDNLISSYEDLDGGEGETYLQDILHLKPIEVSKIQLPALPNIQSSQHSAPKHTTHAVSELLKNLSPSVKSPQVSIKNLQNDMLSSFPNEDIADSPNSSLSKSAGKKSPINDKLESEDNICSTVVETERDTGSYGDFLGDDMQHDPIIFDESEAAVGCHDSQPKTQEVLEDASHLFGEATKDDFSASKKDNNVPHVDGCLRADGDNHPSEVLITNETDARDEILVPSRNEKSNSGANINTPLSEVDANLQNMPDVRTSQEESCPAEVIYEHLENQNEDNALVPPSNGVRKRKAPKRPPNKRKRSRKQNVAGNPHPPEVTDISNLPSENQQVLPAQNTEHQVASIPPSDELRKQKAPRRSQNRKNYTKRQSLAGAGTVWEDGRRKSSRQKFRPLEHWRGERLLLGRVHNSLATVIGVKYAPPGKNHMEVESYVSDEFAHLLAKAAK